MNGRRITPYFDGCLPIEVMAERGLETLRHGPMKPFGLTNPHQPENKPYAVVQLRQDNKLGTLFNMVGFQTKLKHAEQVRIFRTIPGLENAEFARLGGLHRNTFLNSPALLDQRLRLKANIRWRFAGQITGCEGYVESAAVGLLAGRFAAAERRGEPVSLPPPTTAHGALLTHITGGHIETIDAGPPSFQPMNVNFGLFPPLKEAAGVRSPQQIGALHSESVCAQECVDAGAPSLISGSGLQETCPRLRPNEPLSPNPLKGFGRAPNTPLPPPRGYNRRAERIVTGLLHIKEPLPQRRQRQKRRLCDLGNFGRDDMRKVATRAQPQLRERSTQFRRRAHRENIFRDRPHSVEECPTAHKVAVAPRAEEIERACMRSSALTPALLKDHWFYFAAQKTNRQFKDCSCGACRVGLEFFYALHRFIVNVEAVRFDQIDERFAHEIGTPLYLCHRCRDWICRGFTRALP